MTENPLIGLSSILILGMVAQWLAWRLRLPSILVLLLFGFIAGPVTNVIQPDALLGDLLFPLVSLSVAVILFEGGLSLNLSELREIRLIVRRLISWGVLITWAIGTLAAYFVLNLDLSLAILLGAILTVTGPTVVIPLLRHVRPTARVSSAIKWEGILIDPVGATLAVLVFEAVLAGQGVENLPVAVVSGVLITLIVGVVTGLLGAAALYFPLRRRWIPDYLQSPVSLTLVVLAFVIANTLQEESGLLTVTVMGIMLANQRSINIRNIIKFKENLVMLMLSSVFIVLAARLSLTDLSQLGWGSVLFLAIMIFIARPVSVLISSFGSQLNWRERAFVAALAPRGIVAAAVSAVFALELVDHGIPEAEALVPITFFVIVGTVSLYSLSASFVARRLGISQAEPQGILFVGAHHWARQIAQALHDHDIKVLMVDSNFDHFHNARLLGLPVHFGSILSEDIIDELDFNGIGRILALTANDEVNALANLHFAEVFDSANTYQLPPRTSAIAGRNDLSLELRGRYAFGHNITFSYLDERFNKGDFEIHTTPLTEQFTFADFKQQYRDRAIPMFLLSRNGQVDIITTDQVLDPLPGTRIISLISDEGDIALPPKDDLIEVKL